MARDLKAGDPLRLLDGPAAVESVEAGKVQPVFNLDVAEDARLLRRRRRGPGPRQHAARPPAGPFDAAPSLAAAIRWRGEAFDILEEKRNVICLAGYLAGSLTWLIAVTAWLAVRRDGAICDPTLWYDSVHTLTFETWHGIEFMAVTLHLWGSIFAVVALAWTRRRTQPLITISGLLLLIVCFGLLFNSIRWFHGETEPFFGGINSDPVAAQQKQSFINQISSILSSGCSHPDWIIGPSSSGRWRSWALWPSGGRAPTRDNARHGRLRSGPPGSSQVATFDNPDASRCHLPRISLRLRPRVGRPTPANGEIGRGDGEARVFIAAELYSASSASIRRESL